jgi:hypothetical protein
MACQRDTDTLNLRKWNDDECRKAGIVLHDLEETGRLHFFYHCRGCDLPVRDVTDRKKTEPHLEVSAENFCSECNQRLLRGFLKSSEKYLFLMTRCLYAGSKMHGKHCVVGIMLKERVFQMSRNQQSWMAVAGTTRMFGFDDAYPLDQHGELNPFHMRKRVTADKTVKMLEHFSNQEDVLAQCRDRLEKLDPAGMTCVAGCPFKGGECQRKFRT